jgi:isocitrate dehydrogenase
MCQTKDAADQDWVKPLPCARASGCGGVLVDDAAYHAEWIEGEHLLANHDTSGLHMTIHHAADQATRPYPRAAESRRGHHLGDRERPARLPDRPPDSRGRHEREVLSIVPLLNGGGLFETGAAARRPSTAPRKPSPLGFAGRIFARGVARTPGRDCNRVHVPPDTDQATGKLLENRKSLPAKVNELDNRGSHLPGDMGEVLASQSDYRPGWARFAPLGRSSPRRSGDRRRIECRPGTRVDVGGYYAPNPELAARAMRPSATFNQALASL